MILAAMKYLKRPNQIKSLSLKQNNLYISLIYNQLLNLQAQISDVLISLNIIRKRIKISIL